MSATAKAQVQKLKHTAFKDLPTASERVIKCITEDINGFIWTASENALQWFDGSSFHTVPYGTGQHEIPGLIFNQIYRSPEDELWIFYNKGFSVYSPLTHSFKHHKDIIPAVNSAIYFMLADTRDEIVMSSGSNIVYVNRHTKKISRFATDQPAYVNIAPFNVNKDWLHVYDSTGITVSTVDGKYKSRLNRPKPVVDFSFYYFNQRYGLYATNRYLCFYDIASGNLIKTVYYPGDKLLQPYQHPSNIIQKDSRTALALLDDELWEIDLQRMEFSRKLVNLSGNNFIGNGYYKAAMYDSRGNLWVSSNLYGLLKISGKSQPFQLIGPDDERENFVKCFKVNKKANLVLSGTYGKGLFVYDTLGNLLKSFPLANQGERAVITSIGQLDDYNYLVFVHADLQQYHVDCRSMTVSVVSNNHFSPGYYSQLMEFEPGSFFYLNGGNREKVQLRGSQLVFTPMGAADMQKFLAMGSLPFRNADLTAITGNPYFMNCLQQIGLHETGMQVVVKRNDNWLFGTIKGIFEFDATGKLVRTINVKAGLADDYIYSIVIDKNNDIWCGHNKGLSRIDKDGHVFNLNQEDGLQGNEFNHAAAAVMEDGQLFFGGVSGLNAFYPAQLNRIADTPRLTITHISTIGNTLPADTAFWNITSLRVPFRDNQIKINFSAIGNNSAGYYEYQYRVKGLNDEWKSLGHTQEINLALPAGDYDIEIAAGNSFSRDLKAQKILHVKVVPPVYQRWWFLLLIGVMLLAVLALLLQAINKNKYRKKLEYIKMQQELESERQRISRDLHDNMGAYTTALLANVEKLRIEKGENNELQKMKHNADNILNSLRETIWVLNNKEISVSDFSDAFKNYCVKWLQNFDQISFDAREEIESDKILTAVEAIHFDKILKEAFQNIIKHSKATEIVFSVVSRPGLLTLSIADNGIGFDYKGRQKGNGLENMQWRAKEALARLSVETVPGKGCIISISL